jgi:hypothetical protein
MLSPEPKHFEEQILIEGLHTLRWVERPNIFLGHPVVQGLNTERASYYAKELSPTNGRTASLPDKNKTLCQNRKRKRFNLFSNEKSLKTLVIVAIFCSPWNKSHCRHCPS